MIERFKLLLQEMNRGIYEKETEISLSLLAALAGESIILLGPPGVAKSMVARQLKTAFREAQSFEYLMSRFSTPDEIFGPVSIQKLKTSDTYERAVEGYLPTADVVFLDEIWKAGPAIQNTLLTVINEKIFRNGNREMHLPLKLLVAASNELPAKGEGLEALWDRFVIRIESRPIKLEKNFRAMLLESHADFSGSTGVLGHADFADNADFSDLKITAEEYAHELQKIEERVLDSRTRLPDFIQENHIGSRQIPLHRTLVSIRSLQFLNAHRTEDFIGRRESRHQILKALSIPERRLQLSGHHTLRHTRRS